MIGVPRASPQPHAPNARGQPLCRELRASGRQLYSACSFRLRSGMDDRLELLELSARSRIAVLRS